MKKIFEILSKMFNINKNIKKERELNPFFDVGFHGDEHLIKVTDSLITGCDYFIETGTDVGTTLSHVAKKFPNVKCISCEPHKISFDEASKNTSMHENATIYNEDATTFLNNLENIDKDIYSKRCVFWLDAHGYGFDWPLRYEIENITKNFEKAIIFIDDFKVPGMDMFGYDEYNGQVCKFEYIKDSFDKSRNYKVGYPTYIDKTSTYHPLRGWGVFIYGIDDLEIKYDVSKLMKIESVVL